MDITRETKNKLNALLNKGTKIYFFTYDPSDILLEDERLLWAKENQLLFIYEVMFNEILTYNFTYYDGNIPLDQLNVLSEFSALFNKEQFLIEHAPLKQHILVAAGAGTGKTTVMVNRIIFLRHLQPNLTFADIGLITFTNKATLHMRKQLVDRIKLYYALTKDITYLNWIQELKDMEIGTIHSFAHYLLKLNQKTLYNRTDLPISQFNYKRQKIIEKVIDEYHEKYPQKFSYFKYIEQYRLIQVIDHMIKQINNYSISTQSIDSLDFGKSDKYSHLFFEYVVKETIKRLDIYKESREYLSVSDLITHLKALLQRRESIEIPFKYIFIDEFQDTDRNQTKLFSHMANHFSISLFVVGDVKQSIYRFRGADYTAFNQLKEQLLINLEYHLQYNYRSDNNLLKNLNQIFATWPSKVNTFTFQREDYLYSGLNQKTNNETPIINKSFSTSVQLANFLKQFEHTNTAVLVRSNREVNEISQLCDEHKIFYNAEQDGDFYRSLPVREFYQLILRFVQPNLWKNRYLLNLSSYGERNLTSKQILEDFTPNQKHISQLLKNKDKHLHKYEEQFSHRGIFAILDDIIKEVNPAKVHTERFISERKKLYDENQKDLQKLAKVIYQEYQLNLNQLIYLLKKESKQAIPTLHRLERLLRLKITTDTLISNKQVKVDHEQRLNILTIHKAKGLEFDNVFLPNIKKPFNRFIATEVFVKKQELAYKTFIQKGHVYTNDHYERLKSNHLTENIGEEARLLYVALTRAKKQVFINAPKFANQYSVRKWGDLIDQNSIQTYKNN